MYFIFNLGILICGNRPLPEVRVCKFEMGKYRLTDSQTIRDQKLTIVHYAKKKLLFHKKYFMLKDSHD